MPELLDFPQELIERLARDLVDGQAFESPTDLSSFDQTCKGIHRIVGTRNDQLYVQLFQTTFDLAAVKRRFNPTRNQIAQAYRDRIACLNRFRAYHHSNTLHKGDLWTAYLMVLEHDLLNAEQLCKHGHIRTFLTDYYEQHFLPAAKIPSYAPENTESSLVIHLTYFFTSHSTLELESPSVAEERFYVLKPYVFCANHYPAQLASWAIRKLPANTATAQPSVLFPTQNTRRAAEFPIMPQTFGELDEPPLDTVFSADHTPHSRKSDLLYFGTQISLATPLLFLGALFQFEMRVDRDPEISGQNAAGQLYDMLATFSTSDSSGLAVNGAGQHLLGADDRPMTLAEVRTTLIAARAATTSSATPLPVFLSTSHDFDFRRLQACADPFAIRSGLTVDQLRGMFAGTFEGRFSFFDFDSYREMLAGRKRSILEGPFRSQPQVWRMEEVVVRILSEEERAAEGGLVEGGTGAMLNAGFDLMHSAVLPNLRQTEDWRAPPVVTNSDSPISRFAENNLNLRSEIAAGRVLAPHAKLVPGARYEILLSASGHSAWGSFALKGRVRTWDGLFSLVKEYDGNARGRWLYRGYATVGSNILAGKWRDTFTNEGLHGYEGNFVLSRRQ